MVTMRSATGGKNGSKLGYSATPSRPFESSLLSSTKYGEGERRPLRLIVKIRDSTNKTSIRQIQQRHCNNEHTDIHRWIDVQVLQYYSPDRLLELRLVKFSRVCCVAEYCSGKSPKREREREEECMYHELGGTPFVAPIRTRVDDEPSRCHSATGGCQNSATGSVRTGLHPTACSLAGIRTKLEPCVDGIRWR
jgi:hypothetical protein